VPRMTSRSSPFSTFSPMQFQMAPKMATEISGATMMNGGPQCIVMALGAPDSKAKGDVERIKSGLLLDVDNASLDLVGVDVVDVVDVSKP